MPYELIICEKPKAAQKIADALADGKAIKKSEKGVPYYEVTHGNKDLVIAAAVGHLYGVSQSSGTKSEFPVFNVEWKPTADIRKSAKFSKKYLNVLKKLAKKAKEFTVATDYDIEGEVIGLNIIRYACNKKDANRMKFSTLTKIDLIKAYENKSKTLDWGQANAGETRHFLDWYYGINLSRALTHSTKAAGSFKLMSTGRVQGPALKLIVDKEKEIHAFEPVPYWQLQLLTKNSIEAWHEQDKFWEKDKVDVIYGKVKSEKTVKVKKITRHEFEQAPPIPFDLTSMQIEAHRLIRVSPKRTLQLAQELYTAGFISYPRTSSQKLPKEIGYKKILESLKKNFKEAEILLKKKVLKPNEGKKIDLAHPAIYPTGILAKGLSKEEAKLYELIVRRFLATFGDPAVRETMNIIIDCKQETFIAKGTRTKEKGWHILYGKFAVFKEEELPSVKEGEVLNVKKINLLNKETQPPKRYTDASIIKELEKRNLGTKATRANIIDTLVNREYIEGKPLHATEIGIRTADTLEKYSPMIVDEELTRNFELEMDRIRGHKKNEKEVLEDAKEILKKIIKQFKKSETNIGKELMNAERETRDERNTMGKCPVCKDGTLMVKKGKFGFFIACNKYPDCKATFSLPSGVKARATGKECEHCKYPIVKILRKGRAQDVCINPNCPSKQTEEKEEGRPCPKCKEGKLVLRKSIYGSFYACNRYPKCHYTEKNKEKE